MPPIIQDSEESEEDSPFKPPSQTIRSKSSGANSTDVLRKELVAVHKELARSVSDQSPGLNAAVTSRTKSTSSLERLRNYVNQAPCGTTASVSDYTPNPRLDDDHRQASGSDDKLDPFVPPTLQAAFEQHDPMMFGDVSSTIANNTAELQSMLNRESIPFESQNTPRLLRLSGIENEAISSIPWSAYLASPSQPNSGKQSKGNTQSQTSQSRRTQSESQRSDMSAMRPTKRAKTTHTPDGSPVPIKRSGSTRRSRTDGSLPNAPHSPDVLAFLPDPIHPRSAELSACQNLGSTEQKMANTPSNTGHPDRERRKPGSSSTLRKIRVDDAERNHLLDHAEEGGNADRDEGQVIEEVDELSPDFPKDNKRRRPKRTQSTTQDKLDAGRHDFHGEEDIKDLQTLDSATLATEIPETHERILEMGFTPSQATAALRQSLGDVNRAIDHLLVGPTRSSPVVEIIRKSKRGRKSNEPRSAKTTVTTSVDDGEMTAEHSVVFERDTKLGAKDESMGGSTDTAVTKRKRGRPRKTQSTGKKATGECKEDATSTTLTDDASVDATAGSPEISGLDPTADDAQQAVLDEEKENVMTDDSMRPTEGKQMSPADEISIGRKATAQVIEKPSKTKDVNHTSQLASQAKVPLRVGLSRRVRIAPLLSIRRM